MMLATLILLIVIFVCILVKLITLGKKTMYSYKLMSTISLLFFIGITIIVQLNTMIEFAEFEPTVYFYFFTVADSFSDFTLFVFPVLIAVSLLMLMSNLILSKVNGWSFSNIAGTLIAVGLIMLTLIANRLFGLVLELDGTWSPEVYSVAMLFKNLFLIVVTYLECMFVGSLMCTVRAARHKPKYEQDYMIVLGCYAGDGENLPPILRRRAESALKFAIRQVDAVGKKLIFIASGGKGNDERVSEAKAISNYLVREGVPKGRILLEDKSTNTLQNFKYSKKLIGKRGSKVAFATTGYHVFRSGVLAHEAGLDAVGVSSKAKWYFYANAIMREFVANLAVEKRTHIFNLVSISLASVAIIALCYYNGVF